jgi:hypothetical protein
MDFEKLLAALESLLGGKFYFREAEDDNLYCDVGRHFLKTPNGNVTIYGKARIRFEGNGNYHDNMEFLDSFEDVYDFVVRNMFEHKVKFETKVLLLREAVETMQKLNCIGARFVEEFDTISPIVRVEIGGVPLFCLIPKFRTIFAQFNEDDSFDDTGKASYNGFDLRVSVVAESGRQLPSGFHVFPNGVRDCYAPFGLRAFLTPGCIVTARTLTLKKAIQEEHSAHAFYDSLCSEETVKVIEYTVP